MKTKLLTSIMLMAGVLMIQNVAHATPYVFQFTEAYDSNDSPSIYGTAANISVTVDNGNSSSINQTYSWNDITGVSVTTVGGTFSDVWTGIYRSTDGTTFLATDGSGSFGAMSFGTDQYVNSPGTFFPGGYLQFGSGNFTGLALNFTSSPSAYIYDFDSTTATLINAAVPEPETYAMMLAGLGLLGFVARRRKQKLSA